jgi:hypothetical protein
MDWPPGRLDGYRGQPAGEQLFLTNTVEVSENKGDTILRTAGE